MGVLIAGYHPGAEDDGVYLAAIKHDLNPALFPHDSEFFTVQLQGTIFEELIAGSVRLSHLPVSYFALVGHYLAILLVLWGCWRISCRCFTETHAQWAAGSLVAALLTLPVAGSALYLVDQNLHPRALATAAILAAIVATLDRRYWSAGGFLLLALVIHPIMSSFGISFCVFLGWRKTVHTISTCLALVPLGWIFEPPRRPGKLQRKHGTTTFSADGSGTNGWACWPRLLSSGGSARSERENPQPWRTWQHAWRCTQPSNCRLRR